MRDLIFKEIKSINGGIWCTHNGYPGNGAANQIEIDGNDCSILKHQLSQGHFDTGGFVIGTSASIAGGVASYAVAVAFGFGSITAGAVGIGLATLIGIAYATTHR